MDERKEINKIISKLEGNDLGSSILKDLLKFEHRLDSKTKQWIVYELKGYKFPNVKTLGEIAKRLPEYRLRRGLVYHAPHPFEDIANGNTIHITHYLGQLDEIGIKNSIEDLEKRKKGIIITYSIPSLSNKAVAISQTDVDEILLEVNHRIREIVYSLDKKIKSDIKQTFGAKTKKDEDNSILDKLTKPVNLAYLIIAIIVSLVGIYFFFIKDYPTPNIILETQEAVNVLCNYNESELIPQNAQLIDKEVNILREFKPNEVNLSNIPAVQVQKVVWLIHGTILNIYNSGNKNAINAKLIVKYSKPNFFWDAYVVERPKNYSYDITRQYTGSNAPEVFENKEKFYSLPKSPHETEVSLGDIDIGKSLSIGVNFAPDLISDCGKEIDISFQVIEEGFHKKSNIKNVKFNVGVTKYLIDKYYKK